MFTQSLKRRVGRAPLAGLLMGPHGPDRYTELLDPMWTSEIRATVTGVQHPTPRTVTLLLEPNHPVRWRAGQHVNVTVEIDGRRRTRCYSPANADGSAVLELTITRHPDGVVSEYLCAHARRGMVVGLSEPAGDFVLPVPRPQRMVFIAGGSGITPVLSMLRTLAAEGFGGEMALLYYARTADDVCYRDELAALGVPARYGYTRCAGGDLEGRFADSHLAAVMAEPDAVFVCGPPGLVESVRGIRLDAVAETFTPPAFAPAESTGGRVSFRDSGIGVVDDGRPLLDQAEAAGLTPESGCRMGICHTCTRRKTRGAVRNLITSAVSSADDEDVQICVSVPVGDVEIAL